MDTGKNQREAASGADTVSTEKLGMDADCGIAQPCALLCRKAREGILQSAQDEEEKRYRRIAGRFRLV